MDVNYDEAWCPACDRQIMPKRITVPIPPPDSPPKAGDPISKTKTGTIRPKPGFVKPNVVQPLPTKLRTLIDQGPIPLYCSDDCRMADLTRLSGALSISYNPDRVSPPLPPLPRESFLPCDSEDESSSGSSLDSSLSSSDVVAVSPSIATLAAIYDFPPLPPPPPILAAHRAPPPQPEFRNNYQGGVMMAAKRIQAALCADPATKRPMPRNELPPPQKPIPGWTDGSDAWRESVYSFSPRSDAVVTTAPPNKTSFAATSSRGVQWTSTSLATSSTSASFPAQSRPSHLPRSSQSYTDELYAKYSLPLSRRSESRSALYPSNASSAAPSLPPLSPTSTSSRRRRETPLVKPGAEGRLLVPNITMRAHTASSQSISSASLCSPLSRFPSEISQDSMWNEQRSTSASTSSRLQVQVRSWSYDNIKTYPVMMPPPKKEKRIEARIVDGYLKEVEVEVEIVQPLKRLFLFHGKETSPERKW